MIKAVIFDFNGTLFNDGWIHSMVWDELIEKNIDFKIPLSEREKMVGAINYLFIKGLNKYRKEPFTDEEINKLSKYKESLYREFVLKHSLNQLTKGAIELFKHLIKHNVKIVLCTASIRENVEFFFEDFKLKEWFSFSECVYDDGSFKNKKEMYEKCIESLGLDAEKILVFEDSITGINSAKESGINKIVLVKTSLENLNDDSIVQEIDNFKEFDLNILK